MQKLFTELQDKGFGLVAVNGADEADVINKYVDENKFTFRIGMADRTQSGETYEVAKKYGVAFYPTNYLVDATTGKVLWRGIGFNEQAIRAALANIDIK